MKRRFTLYGFGFVLGIILVIFFLGGKNASCSWFPNDRMLKIIRSKQISYSENIQNLILSKEIDSMDINLILDNGNIDFSESQTKNMPCREYLINGVDNQQNLAITVSICDSIAVIQKIKIGKN